MYTMQNAIKGSFMVNEPMVTEDYSQVIHVVSNVMDRLNVDHDCFDAIRATFPGGTIKGVPKLRCIEIIDELEPVACGPSTGSTGLDSTGFFPGPKLF
ncbi:MAG: chorismate-binding protein [Nitrospirae bacterium]|nr:chorismate-binding protein [Nitrospirota bacterium]